MDQKQVRKRLAWNLASSPWSLAPFLLGATILIGLWTFSISSVAGALAGIGGMVAGIGSFLTRLYIGDSTAQQKTIAQLRQESEAQKIAELDELEDQLEADDDPRTEKMLQDLRALVTTFKSTSYDDNLNAASLVDIASGVEDLFEEGVRMLRKSLEFYRTAHEINDKETRRNILKQRKEILKDVRQSIDQLGKLLTDIKAMDVEDDSQQERIRRELQDSFDIAKRVKEQMSGLGKLAVPRSNDKEMEYV